MICWKVKNEIASGKTISRRTACPNDFWSRFRAASQSRKYASTSTYVSPSRYGIGKPPPAWVVEKVYDSNGDGLSDISWRNTGTDSTVVWQMLGYTRVAAGPTGNVPAPWDVP